MDLVWAAGDTSTLADRAGAPALFHADWVQAIPESFAAPRLYRGRLNEAGDAVSRPVSPRRPGQGLTGDHPMRPTQSNVSSRSIRTSQSGRVPIAELVFTLSNRR